jgi:AcrR family transcriptional regulator
MAKRHVPSPSGKALFSVLPPGRQVISPERVAAHQRQRLQGAMVAAVAESGYAAITLKQLVSLAGVSRTTFYKHFADKEQCFLATYDAIATIAGERVSSAYRRPGEWRARVQAGFTSVAELIVAEPAAAHLVLVDALGAGHRVLEHREAMTDAFELMLRQSFEEAPQAAIVSDSTIRAIVSGIRRVAYRRLIVGEPEQLNELLEDLLEWALVYHQPGVDPPSRPPIPVEPDSPKLEQALRESAIPALDPVKARATHSHRQRILHAVISLSSEGGYPALSMPAIAARAGLSNEAFYENFTDKQDAFLAACREAVKGALKASVRAFSAASCWPQGVAQTIVTLVEYLASDPVFARIAFFEIFTGGPAAVELAEQMFQSFTAMFQAGHEQHPQVPEVVSEAITGGLWNIIQHEIGHGRAAQLPELAPELLYIALTPFLGAQQAAQMAREPAVRAQLAAES